MNALQFGMVCEQEWLVSMAQSVFFSGGVIGSIVLGWIADKWGRRPALLVCTVLMVVGNVATIMPPDYWWYIAMRFIAGLSHPSAFNIGFMLGELPPLA